jgi:hypothetical protein
MRSDSIPWGRLTRLYLEDPPAGVTEGQDHICKRNTNICLAR